MAKSTTGNQHHKQGDCKEPCLLVEPPYVAFEPLGTSQVPVSHNPDSRMGRGLGMASKKGG